MKNEASYENVCYDLPYFSELNSGSDVNEPKNKIKKIVQMPFINRKAKVEQMSLVITIKRSKKSYPLLH